MAVQVSGNLCWSWWVMDKAVAVGSDLYFAGITADGNWRILKNDGNTYATLGTGQIDDHNPPCIVASVGKPTICFYTEHGRTHYVRYKVAPVGTLNFGSEKRIQFGEECTYSQTLVKDDTIVLLTRSSSGKWRYTVSSDYGSTWSPAYTLISAGAKGKIYSLTSPTEIDPSIYHFVSYGHPNESVWRDIIYATIDMNTGDIKNFAGDIVANLFTRVGLPMGTGSTDVVWTPSSSNEKVRLLDVGDKRRRPIVYYAKWEQGSLNPDYYQAVRNHQGVWEHGFIVSTGGNFEGTSRNYVGGIAIDRNNREYVYLSRKDGDTWKIERYQMDLRMQAYSPVVLAESDKPLVRPVTPRGRSVVLYQHLEKYNSYLDFTSYIYRAS